MLDFRFNFDDEKFADHTVQELESLKGILSEIKGGSNNGDDIYFSKSETSSFSDINGRKSSHKEIKNEVDRNGKLLAKISQKIDQIKNKDEKPKSKIQTEIEIPSKGIHHTVKNDENLQLSQGKKESSNFEFKRARNGIDKTNSFADIKYSPRDLAEYIFWTGDDKGVALTVEEFVQEGVMSLKEAITFLQSIKHKLDLMKSHYQDLHKMEKKVPNKLQEGTTLKHKFLKKGNFGEKSEGNSFDEQQENENLPSVDLLSVKSGSPEIMSADMNIINQNDQMSIGKSVSNHQEYSEQRNKSFSKFPPMSKTFETSPANDDDYDQIMERLKVAGLLQKEYSLEEVIFELAKIMFTESLTKGNPEAQKAMQRFSDFLQNQVEHNQISRNLQRKILDILSSALMEALSEHPELLNTSMTDQNSPTSDALKQLLMLGTKQFSGPNNSKEELAEKSLILVTKKLYKGVK